MHAYASTVSFYRYVCLYSSSYTLIHIHLYTHMYVSIRTCWLGAVGAFGY